MVLFRKGEFKVWGRWVLGRGICVDSFAVSRRRGCGGYRIFSGWGVVLLL